MVNPFQQGQNFANARKAKVLANVAEEKRQEGVNVLAEEFGPQAFAPTEAAQLRGTARADKQFIAREEQRGLNNERTARLDEVTEEERVQKNMISGLTQIVGGIKAGVKGGAPIEEVITRFAPVLKNAFGVSDEELLALPQSIQENPGLLDDIEGALRTGSKKKAIGAPVTIRMPDGSLETRQRFNDGTFDILPGVDVKPLTAQERVDVSQQNVNIAAKKVDPFSVGLVSGAKEAGKGLSKAVIEGLPEAQNLVNTIANGERALDLIDGGIRTGSLVDVRQGASRFFADIIGVEQEQIAETDEFKGLVGAFVAEQIKAFGAGTGLSDADREFAKGIVGGDITMDAVAVKRLVTIQNRINRGKVKNFNSLRDAFIKRNPDFGEAYPRVNVPAERGAKKRRIFNPATGRLE